MKKDLITNSKYSLADKLLLFIGGIGIVLFIINSVMFHILPMLKFSPIWWAELWGFLFCLLVIFGGFFRFKALFIIVLLSAPRSIFFGILAIIQTLQELPLQLFDTVNGLLGILNIVLSLTAFLGLFFWWKEFYQKKPFRN